VNLAITPPERLGRRDSERAVRGDPRGEQPGSDHHCAEHWQSPRSATFRQPERENPTRVADHLAESNADGCADAAIASMIAPGVERSAHTRAVSTSLAGTRIDGVLYPATPRAIMSAPFNSAIESATCTAIMIPPSLPNPVDAARVVVAKRDGGVSSGRRQCRQYAADRRGKQGRACDECHSSRAGGEVHPERHVAQGLPDPREDGLRRRETDRSRGHAQKKDFDEDLTDQASARRTERRPYGELSCFRGRPCENEARDVCGDDDEHEHRHATSTTVSSSSPLDSASVNRRTTMRSRGAAGASLSNCVERAAS
jgi:hypothetical protein